MRAALLETQPGELQIADVDIDSPRRSEVLIRVVASGLCHSDAHFLDNSLPLANLPAVLGHEVAGIVEAVGPDTHGLATGDHVVACLSIYCGGCVMCERGEQYLCVNRQSTARGQHEPARLSHGGAEVYATAGIGGFAERVLLSRNAVTRIDREMPLDLAAVLGCAVTTGLGAATNTADIRLGDSVAVIGCGGVGLNIVQGARLSGAGKIIAVDLSDHKLEIARQFGATQVVNAGSEDTADRVRHLTGGLGVDHAFEAIGLTETAERAIAITRAGGASYLVGVLPYGVSVSVPGAGLWAQGKRLQGVHMGSNRFQVDIPRYVELYQQGRLKLTELVSDRIGLDDVMAGFATMLRGELTRAVILFD